MSNWEEIWCLLHHPREDLRHFCKRYDWSFIRGFGSPLLEMLDRSWDVVVVTLRLTELVDLSISYFITIRVQIDNNFSHVCLSVFLCVCLFSHKCLAVLMVSRSSSTIIRSRSNTENVIFYLISTSVYLYSTNACSKVRVIKDIQYQGQIAENDFLLSMYYADGTPQTEQHSCLNSPYRRWLWWRSPCVCVCGGGNPWRSGSQTCPEDGVRTLYSGGTPVAYPLSGHGRRLPWHHARVALTVTGTGNGENKYLQNSHSNNSLTINCVVFFFK